MKDGGSAFPMSSGDEPRMNQTTHYNEGMSLRDWFAGMALRGINIEEQADLQYAVEEAFAIADAMLVARAVEA
ncbi:MAG: hypothetical protein KAY24_17705 [Candidatus Eisenbacteria sp.]|nr:hypothetical protein [Candidatus Eisenbacteria bacterium]